MTQRAVGVHEWCEIRLIRPLGRLALCEESGRIWYSWAPFWLLFNSLLFIVFWPRWIYIWRSKKWQQTLDFYSWGCHPKPAILFVLKQKVSKKFKAYDLFATSYVYCMPRNPSHYAALHFRIA